MQTSFRSTGVRGRRTGLVLNSGLVLVDSQGFDDVNSFWESAIDPKARLVAVIPPLVAASATAEQYAPLLFSPPETAESPPSGFRRYSDMGQDDDEGDEEGFVVGVPPNENSLNPGGDDSGGSDGGYDAGDPGDPGDDYSYGDAGGISGSGFGGSSQRFGDGGEADDSDDGSGTDSPLARQGDTEEEATRASKAGKKASDKASKATKAATAAKASKTPRSKRRAEEPSEGETEEERDDTPEVEDEEGDAHVVSDDSGSKRRSKRVKYPVLEYWKNERYLFERKNEGIGEVLPVVAGITERTKTPVPQQRQSKAKGGRKTALDQRDLPQTYTFKKSDKGRVWMEKELSAQKQRVICRAATMDSNVHQLPVTAERGVQDDSRVASAAQAFFAPVMSATVPGWISGYVSLPPKAIKDAEGVGNCAQVFFVGDCQHGSVEVALAYASDRRVVFDPDTAQRFLLGPGDQFYVPPHNVYRLQNHSTLKEARLSWIIIKPLSGEDDGESDGSEE